MPTTRVARRACSRSPFCSPSSPTSIASASPPRRRSSWQDLQLTVLQMSVGVQRVHARLLAVRDSVGLARRRRGSAPRADAHRAVVVGVHDADRCGRRVSVAAWRSGSCSAPAKPARFRTSRAASRSGFRRASAARANGVLFLGSRMGGHAVGADRAAADRALGLARELRRLRRARARVGGGVVRVVSRPARRSTRRRTRRSSRGFEQDRRRRRGRSPMPRPRRGARCCASRNLYAICAMYFAFGYGLYFYFTWLPTYLIRELGFSLLSRRVVRRAAVSARRHRRLAGGWLTDYLARTRGLRVGALSARLRRRSHVRGASARVDVVAAPVAKAVLLALALASADFALGACWAVCRSTSRPTHAGVVTGFMNTFGNLGGLIGPLVVGYRGRSLALVDVSVLHHRARVRGRRDGVAGDRSDASCGGIRSSREHGNESGCCRHQSASP